MNDVANVFYNNRAAVMKLLSTLKQSDIEIIDLIQKKGWLSMVGISRDTGLSFSYVTKRIKVLLELELIKKSSHPQPRYNLTKPATKVKLSSDKISVLLSEIRAVYPKNRASLQPATAKTAFTAIINNEIKNNNSEEAALDLVSKIKDSIAALRQSSAWTKNNGKYVPGLGNFLLGEAWKNPIQKEPAVSQERKVLDEELSSLF